MHLKLFIFPHRIFVIESYCIFQGNLHTLIFLQVNRGVLETLGVKHCITSAYHPQANGQAERTNHNIKEALAKYCGEGQNDWDAHLKGIVASINTSKQVILCNSCICIHSTLNQDKKRVKCY
jgi:hypothetical protein